MLNLFLIFFFSLELKLFFHMQSSIKQLNRGVWCLILKGVRRCWDGKGM